MAKFIELTPRFQLVSLLTALLLSTFLCFTQLKAQESPWDVDVGVAKRRIKPSQNTLSIESITLTEIHVYIDTFCKECERLLAFLRTREIPFAKHQIGELSRGWIPPWLGGITPPLTILNYSNQTQRRLTGFDEKILSQLLAKDQLAEQLNANDGFALSDQDL